MKQERSVFGISRRTISAIIAKVKNAPTFQGRVNKRLSDLGICSRREAEVKIANKEIWINGALAEIGQMVSEHDTLKVGDVKIDNKLPKVKLFLFHKPRGCVTTNSDPEGRPTVFDYIPKSLGRLMTVGRLDYETEGLLLLTNRGDMARELELPVNNIARKYRVRVFGSINMRHMQDCLDKGITVKGIKYKNIIMYPERPINEEVSGNNWLNIIITEGKNREVRNIMAHFNLQVAKLERQSFGSFELGRLEPRDIFEWNLYGKK